MKGREWRVVGRFLDRRMIVRIARSIVVRAQCGF